MTIAILGRSKKNVITKINEYHNICKDSQNTDTINNMIFVGTFIGY
jgi:hypothetical protein